MSHQSTPAEPLFTFPIRNGMRKLKELIIYIANVSKDDPNFGAIKLNKILYYSDFRAYARTGSPITGVRYFKLPRGPAPRAMSPVQHELIEERSVNLETVPIGPFVQKRIVACRDPDLSLFTDDELALVNEVISELSGLSATAISEASHDIRWRALQMYDDMPYQFASLSNAPLTQRDRQRTEELKRKYGW
ncbi:Panacea domain-containing protein [Paracoccus sanguinis]|uniref:Panacea domain-containing protein n=1 Tax=Paracoccus sanguinis TaxID=1545044 RepID=UPI0014520D47|nr:Panacea domain-containing protein [Paracoccus sanguinis]QJD16809.1 SocA family protein [Paracoccus sanguinis]